MHYLGGEKTREKPFPKHPIIGEEEKNNVLEVLDSQNLSTFRASPGEFFLGGKKIRKFEEEFSRFVGVKYAVAFNSATSALHAAIVSVGVEPGQEVIVPPYTFTSTATCALMHNAIPVFADVSNDTYCIEPTSIEKNVSSLTKAIIPVHLFGHPAEMDEILHIAKKNNLKIIEDCAQAIGAKYKGKNVGTIGDCGIFSFQETKALATGEGGMLVTNDEEIVNTARMVRNHGETILEDQERTYRSEFLGWGYRMTELEAAIGIAQLGRVENSNKIRQKLANYVTKNIEKIEGLTHTKKEYVEHAYWFYALNFNEEKIGISREQFVQALIAEGIPFGMGYVKPLYLNPIYQERKPFPYRFYKGNTTYEKGICPNAERLYEKDLISTMNLRSPCNETDAQDIINAIFKIIENKEEFQMNEINL